MLMSGKLKYTDDFGGSYTYSLQAFATTSDLDIILLCNPRDYESNDDFESALGVLDADAGLTAGGIQGDLHRRIVVSLGGNKYKSNLQHIALSGRIAGAVRFALSRSSIKEVSGESITKTLDFKDATGNTIKGSCRICDSVVRELSLLSRYVTLELIEDPTISYNEIGKSFSKFEQKDKYGNIKSKTPVKNYGYKLEFATIGVTPEVKQAKDINTLYIHKNIKEAIDANPGKNFDWLLKYGAEEFEIVTDENLERVMQELDDDKGVIICDTETTDKDGINFKSRTGESTQLVGMVLCGMTSKCYYFPLKNKYIKNLCNGDDAYFMEKYMRPLLETRDIVVHNTQFDWGVVYIYDIAMNVVFDTLLAYQVTKGYQYLGFTAGLKALTRDIFGVDSLELDDLCEGGWANGVRFWDLPEELVKYYACADVYWTRALYKHIKEIKLLEEYGAQRVFQIEIDFAKASAYSEFWGVKVAVSRRENLVLEVEKDRAELYAKMREYVPYEFNPASSKQLGVIIFDELYPDLLEDKVVTSRTTKKEILKELLEYTNEDGSLRYPFIVLLLKYRKTIAASNFINATDSEFCDSKGKENVMTEDGYIFPSIYALGTKTGRASTKGPNIQGFSETIKRYIVPREGFCMGDTDFGQIEYRVLASLSGQESLIQAFENLLLDYHRYQASRMFDVRYNLVSDALRSASKGINFGLPFGMEDPSLGKRIFGKRTPENTRKASKYRALYFTGQEKVLAFFERVRSEGVSKGYTTTYFGRRRYYFKGKFSTSEIRRQAGNAVIQGTAADIYKLAVGRLFNRVCKEGWLGKVLFNAFIHDELLFEKHESIPMREFMKAWHEEYELSLEGFCRILAGIGWGYNWYDAKSKELSPVFMQHYFAHEDLISNDIPDSEYVVHFYEEQEKFNLEFVTEYLTDKNNFGKEMSPEHSVILQGLLGAKKTELVPHLLQQGYTEEELADKRFNFEDINKNVDAFYSYIGFDVGEGKVIGVIVSENKKDQMSEKVTVGSTEMTYADYLNLQIDEWGAFFDIKNSCVYMDASNQANAQKIVQAKGVLVPTGQKGGGYCVVLRVRNAEGYQFFATQFYIPSENIQSVQSLALNLLKVSVTH